MDKKEFIECFKQDCAYYDLEQKELNIILSLVEFKPGERLIDIGAGLGRLAILLSRYVKVTAVDTDKILLNEIDSKIEVINMKIEKYFPEKRFDYALIAWPQCENYELIFDHIKNKVFKRQWKINYS